ncbi:hypothetical protein [Geofilum rubicundum]|nr:hypothetical protein [Geofilum rubicundum]
MSKVVNITKSKADHSRSAWIFYEFPNKDAHKKTENDNNELL